jgi:hypothetical protein
MELVKDVDTDYKDYVTIRNFLKQGYSRYGNIKKICNSYPYNILDVKIKINQLVDWGQVERKRKNNGAEYKYTLVNRLPEPYSAVGVEFLGGIRDEVKLGESLEFAPLLSLISKFYNQNINDVLSSSRKREIVMCRHIFSHIAFFNIPNVTKRSIGKFLGARDHSTAINSISRVAGFLEVDKDFKAEYDKLLKYIDLRIKN